LLTPARLPLHAQKALTLITKEASSNGRKGIRRRFIGGVPGPQMSTQ
jgi:hypothetical protein